MILNGMWTSTHGGRRGMEWTVNALCTPYSARQQKLRRKQPLLGFNHQPYGQWPLSDSQPYWVRCVRCRDCILTCVGLYNAGLWSKFGASWAYNMTRCSKLIFPRFWGGERKNRSDGASVASGVCFVAVLLSGVAANGLCYAQETSSPS